MVSCSAATVAMCWTTASPALATPSCSMASRYPANPPATGIGSTKPPGKVGGASDDGSRWRSSGGGTGTPGSSGAPDTVQMNSRRPDSRASRANTCSSSSSPEVSQRTAPKTCSWALSRCVLSACTAAATSWAMAMKGTDNGTSRMGKPRASAAASDGPGQRRHVQVGGHGQARDAGVVEPFDVRSLLPGSAREPQPGGHDQLGTGQPRTRIIQFADVGPGHPPPEAFGAGQQSHLQCRRLRQLLHCENAGSLHARQLSLW